MGHTLDNIQPSRYLYSSVVLVNRTSFGIKSNLIHCDESFRNANASSYRRIIVCRHQAFCLGSKQRYITTSRGSTMRSFMSAIAETSKQSISGRTLPPTRGDYVKHSSMVIYVPTKIQTPILHDAYEPILMAAVGVACTQCTARNCSADLR